MSDARAYVVYGFRATRGTFFKKTGSEVRCAKGHPSTSSGKFCSTCGGAFKEMAVEQATAKFTEFATKLIGSENAEDCWQGFLEDEYYIEGRKYPPLGLHRVGSVESSCSEGSPTAIGFKLETPYADGRGQTCAHSLVEVEKRFKWLQQAADDLGVEDPKFELFLTCYWII